MNRAFKRLPCDRRSLQLASLAGEDSWRIPAGRRLVGDWRRHLATSACVAPTAAFRETSVVNVSQLITLSRGFLRERAGRLPARAMNEVAEGLRLALAL